MAKVPTLREMDTKGKTVFLRCAFDVPLDSSKKLLDPKRVRDDSRIKDPLPTLSYLIKNNAKVILQGGWLGRPKGEDPDLSMAPVALRLSELLKEQGLLKHPVMLTPNCLDGSRPRSVYRNRDEVVRDVGSIKEGQVILLENVRYDQEANSNDEKFAEFMASLAGSGAVYVTEAEAQNHRPEATVTTVPGIICKMGGKAAFGLKYEDVIKYVGNIAASLETPGRGPFIFFLSGKKIETQVGITSKISVTHSLLDKMRKGDIIVVQGAVTYTFLLAHHYLGIIEERLDRLEKTAEECNQRIQSESKRLKKENKDAQLIAENEAKLQTKKSDMLKEILGISDSEIKQLIGNSFVEWKEIGEQILFAARVCLKAQAQEVAIITNADHTITDKFPDKYGNLPAGAQIKSFDSAVGIAEGWLGVAPGQRTMEIICRNTQSASMLILAGPLSIEDERVERFSRTNMMLFDSIRKAKSNGAITIGAGGDTAAIIRRAAAEDAFTIISNAGGATLELIEKGTLPGIQAVEDCYR